MKFLCTLILLLIASHSALAQTTIAEVRKMKSGKVVTVAGRVTVAGEFGDLSFLQDHTAGIAVYGVKVMVLPGDSVRVTGELKKYNGMLEIVSDTMYIIASGLGPITPKAVDFPEDHEGELVRLSKARLEPQGLFFYPQRAGMLLTSRDTIEYWIDEDTDIPGYLIPAGTTSITGVVGRFGDQIQILPRSHTDIPAAAPPPVKAITTNLRILNWNLEFFGASRKMYGSEFGPSNETLQIQNVAKVLNSTHADLMALQEISDDNAFNDLLKLMPGYEGRCSNRYSYSFDTSDDFPPQKLCFIYKTSTVKVIREKALFRKMFDDNPSDMFSSGRLPYLLEVDAVGHRLFLINIHAKSGAAEADRLRRLSDARLLKDSLDHYYGDKKFVLLGDFNDDFDQSIVAGRESPYSGFDSCVSKSLSETGWHSTISYDDMIDHQVVSRSLTDFFVSVNVTNVFSLIPLYGRTTSDHLPVMSEFDMTKLVTGLAYDRYHEIYPNPTTGEIWLGPDATNVTIINSTGIVVYKKTGAHSPVSIRECAPGLYTLILENQVVRVMKH